MISAKQVQEWFQSEETYCISFKNFPSLLIVFLLANGKRKNSRKPLLIVPF